MFEIQLNFLMPLLSCQRHFLYLNKKTRLMNSQTIRREFLLKSSVPIGAGMLIINQKVRF
ncbi:MAG: hypothetical protein C0433_13315 [Cyclobacterium sp.]|nr:hypothetical protein [Cyclobacterium sp.]